MAAPPLHTDVLDTDVLDTDVLDTDVLDTDVLAHRRAGDGLPGVSTPRNHYSSVTI